MNRCAKIALLVLLPVLLMGAIIQSGVTTDQWTIDATSKAGRVTDYTTSGRAVALQDKATYSAASGSYTPPATPTDTYCIFGSDTKTVTVTSFILSGIQTTAGINTWTLLVRSSANSGGTSVNSTSVPHDSTSAAASVTPFHYTANPTTGTLVGNIRVERTLQPQATSVAQASYDFLAFSGRTLIERPIILRGVSQGLCLNFAGAALPAGSSWAANVTWTEE